MGYTLIASQFAGGWKSGSVYFLGSPEGLLTCRFSWCAQPAFLSHEWGCVSVVSESFDPPRGGGPYLNIWVAYFNMRHVNWYLAAIYGILFAFAVIWWLIDVYWVDILAFVV